VPASGDETNKCLVNRQ